MDKEMMKRVRTAGVYQKKAIRALFPEEMSGHLDVIEAELKAMLVEAAMEMMMEHKSSPTDEEDCCTKDQTSETNTKTKAKTTTKARKVEII